MTAKQTKVPRDYLKLEECPLHTEKPQWEAHAPAQIKAALKRGADVIGFTELGPAHKTTIRAAETLCKQFGYVFHSGTSDAALAYKKLLPNAKAGTAHVAGRRGRNHVSFTFFGRTVTVFTDHWETMAHDKDGAVRKVQTHSMISDMDAASAGPNLSFCMADCNPSLPLRVPTGQPQRDLKAGGIISVWDELNHFPKGVGVTLIARNLRDTAVRAESVVLHADLGSDHQPATAVYSIKRRKTHR